MDKEIGHEWGYEMGDAGSCTSKKPSKGEAGLDSRISFEHGRTKFTYGIPNNFDYVHCLQAHENGLGHLRENVQRG